MPNTKTGALAPLAWRFVAEKAGTGALGDLGCHMVDLLRFITGGEFTRLTSDFDTFIKKRPLPGGDGSVMGDVDVDDYIDIAGQMAGAGGPIAANVSISRYAYARGNYQRIEVYGDSGALRYTLENGDKLEINIGNDPMKEARIWVDVPIPHRFRCSQAQAFADILNGCPDGLAATVADGLQTQKVLDAAVAAAANVVKL